MTLPVAERGKWAIGRIVISLEQSKFSLFKAGITGRGYVPPGTYTKLTCQGRGIVMSDTPDERMDHFEPVRRATGHCLINGLGLGMVLGACLRKTSVTAVTVVEVDADVIALVGPHYADPRVNIIHANAYDYKPPKGERYGMVWHDIWDDMSPDRLPEMTRLKRKYGRRADWQGCWGEALIR